jgi:hypothetical protein
MRYKEEMAWMGLVTQVATLESFSVAVAAGCHVPLLPASSLVRDDWASWGALRFCKAYM